MKVDYLTAADSQGKPEKPASMPLESLGVDAFANTRDSRFYFDAGSHQHALGQLKAMLDNGNQGWASLCGAPGLGKTLLRTVLHRQLDPLRFVTVSIESSLLGFDELLLEIISQIHGERVYGNEFPDRYSRLAELKMLLTEQVVQSGRHLVLLLDEAHGLDKDTLEKLRNLSNICAEQSNLMSIVLIGGTRLESTLRSLPELSQRIAVQTRLQALDAEQTGAYVQHRLNVAGCRQAMPFDTADLQELHRVSQGIPREINAVLNQAITIARQSGKQLDADKLREALNTRSGAYTAQNNEFQSPGMI